MAYNPTTWGSNDVITKDRLNKMEQGIVSASKLSGTDIDTDKDWNGKSITNVGAIQGDSPVHENDLEMKTSKAGHVVSCLNMGGPSSKANYSR